MGSLDDLAPWMQRAAEAAYERRVRKQTSREDFFDGYVSALRDIGSISSFKPGRFEPNDEDRP